MPTKKTPQQRLAELNEQQAKIEDELKQKRAAITRKKRQQQAKLTNEKRREDTRRKVLDGALLQHLVATEKITQKQIVAARDSFLTRNDDRALFDLPPLPEASDASEQPNEPRPETTATNHGE